MSKIPKLIFQTFKTKYFSNEFQSIIDTWKTYNPEYKYAIYDNTDCEEFIEKHFHKRVSDAYKRILPGAFKADLWRYCVLYIYGGVYVDIDTECLGKLDDFLNDEKIEFMTPIDLDQGYKLFNTFICSVPNSPILLNCIQRIVHNVENNILPSDRLDFSGPGILGRSVNTYLNKEETSPFRDQYGLQGSIYLLYFESTTEYVKNQNNTILFQNKNGNQMIQYLYHLETQKAKTICWVNSPKILA